MVSGFYRILDKKDALGQEDLMVLSEILTKYPYFVGARKLYLKALQSTGSIHFNSEISKSLVYMSDKRNFYFYLYPDMKFEDSNPVARKEKFTGSYFDLLEIAGDEKENSLKKLAEKLKSARLGMSPKPKVEVPVIDYFKLEQPEPDADEEEKMKILIKKKKYKEALELLKRLNLNNPKKSVYFADQIRFLEKVIQFQHN